MKIDWLYWVAFTALVFGICIAFDFIGHMVGLNVLSTEWIIARFILIVLLPIGDLTNRLINRSNR